MIDDFKDHIFRIVYITVAICNVSAVLKVCEYMVKMVLNVDWLHAWVKAPAVHSAHISLSHLHKRFWAANRPSTRDSKQAEQKKEEEKKSLWHFTCQRPQAELGALCHIMGQGSHQHFLLTASRLHDVILLISSSKSHKEVNSASTKVGKQLTCGRKVWSIITTCWSSKSSC